MFKVIKCFLYYVIIQFILLFFICFNYLNSGNEPSLFNEYINNNRMYISLLLGIIFIPFLVLKYKKLNIIENKVNDILPFVFLGISLSLVYNVFGFYFDKLLNNCLYGLFDLKSVLISTCLIGPVLEEYLFRGIIYNESLKKYSLKKSIFITTLVFAFAHTNIIQFIYAFIIGYVLIRVYDKYKNIKLCITIHIFSNLTTTFLTLLLIKENIVFNLTIFLIGFFVLLFIKNKKYDII